MNVSIVGTGHVGLTTAACLAHIGHRVLGVDRDAAKIDAIARGSVPFHEPGLSDLVREGLETGRLTVDTDVSAAAAHGELAFICVGTPSQVDGRADLSQVREVTEVLAGAAKGPIVLAQKSTVPVGTAAWLIARLREAGPETRVEIASNPEFLQEGRAVQDTLEPNRIVIGADGAHAAELLREVYRPIVDRTGCPVILTDPATAELVKHASNAFLATKISFANQVADIAEAAGADVEVAIDAMGLDPRIGHQFLRPGLGFGGGCLPKDLAAFRARSQELEVPSPLLAAVEDINEGRRRRFVEKIREALGDLNGRRVTVWGLAFKPETDDVRQSAAVDVVRRLIREGAHVVASDPAACEAARQLVPEATYVEDPLEAARRAEALAVCTEWGVYATIDLERLRAVMARPIVIDGRNVFDPDSMAKAGFRYVSTGRPPVGEPA